MVRRGMKLTSIALVLAAARVAAAEPEPAERMYACHKPSADSKLTASFKPDTSLADLALWFTGFTCKNVVFSEQVAKRATRVTVMTPKDMTPKQAEQLFVDSIEATGLVVVQKPDTVIVKLGPNMPASCPDVAATTGTTVPPAITADDQAVDARLAKEVETGVSVRGPRQFTISKALYTDLLMHPMWAAKTIRIVPGVKDGKPSGLQLYGIRDESLWAKIGLKNHDRLVVLNAQRITSVDKALELFAKLKDETVISFEIERDGATTAIEVLVK